MSCNCSGKIDKTSKKDSIELARDILQKYGLTLEEGKGLKPAKWNGKTGFPLTNHSAYQAIHELAKITGCS